MDESRRMKFLEFPFYYMDRKIRSMNYSTTADKATDEDYEFVCHQISFVGRTKLEALHAGKAQMQHLGNLGKARVNFHFLYGSTFTTLPYV